MFIHESESIKLDLYLSGLQAVMYTCQSGNILEVLQDRDVVTTDH